MVGGSLIRTITSDPTFKALAARVSRDRGPFTLEGLWGSSAPILSALLAEHTGRLVLYVTPHLEQADEARDDMELVAGDIELLSAFESLPGEGSASGEISGERLRLCHELGRDGAARGVIVAPIQALMQPVPTPQALQANSLSFGVGAELATEKVLEWLTDQDFTRLEWVEQPGDFAVRGGIIDIFAYDYPQPIRLELLGDQIESIRLFDLSSQRSVEQIPAARVSALSGMHRLPRAEATNFLTYLPDEAMVLWHEPLEIQELGQTFWDRLDNPRGMFPVQNVLALAEQRCQLYCARFGGPAVAGRDRFHFDVVSVQRFETQPTQAVAELLRMADDKRITLLCDNAAEQRRFRELVLDQRAEFPSNIELQTGLLHHGFEWRSANHMVLAHHELFHRYRQQRKIRKTYASRPLESWLDLKVSDYVVHVVHGIARFRGLAPLRKGDSTKTEEYLTLEFADQAVLHVPASQINLVQKYIGAGGIKPALSKLGGTRWRKTKERVQEAIDVFADELLRVQALRESLPGTAYPQDTPWQREFEESFIYTETEDQLQVIGEIKDDLARPRPMDRLVCGDVGYGKTEVAMRAAFKVVEYGRQVAVLVPTTVLAEQHYHTFKERMADYPFIIGCLSRFRPAAEQRRLVQAARKGQIDVLIGTHRLLSADVNFANLGLIVVDEEQRFGVEHKERLKRLSESVEVLTLTATPIPRTLHMALVGIRDISSLATPPMDRRSIVTQVKHYDGDLVRSAIIRELNRDGQVFFMHNLVHDIRTVADDLQRLVPEARIVVGHGQMKPEALEDVMLRFVNHEADVLVCTNIIESGIDIPSANTIFIDRADRVGLADLHQLRGRVGRYRHRAYCYLLLSRDRTVTPAAAKRLKAIEEFSELGAGFRIAMRDLEIRGAGNILGPEQSGHIAAVGYEMFCQLVEQTVRRMKGDSTEIRKPVHLELGTTAHIPKNYIRSDSARMEIYRRLAMCGSVADVQVLEQDLGDAFGPYPPPVQTLLDLAELRILAQQWTIRSIIVREPDVVFEFEDLARAESVFRPRAGLDGTVRMPDPRTVHWRVPGPYLEKPTLLAVLRRRLCPA